MKLTGDSFQQLRDALNDAFNENTLRAMLRIELEVDLDAIVAPGPRLTRIEDLIRWAEYNGCIQDLLTGALAENPTNQQLAAVELAFTNDRPDPFAPPRAVGDDFDVPDISDVTGVAIRRGRTGSDQSAGVTTFNNTLERTLARIHNRWLLIWIVIVIVLGAVAIFGTRLLSMDFRLIVVAMLFLIVLVATGHFFRNLSAVSVPNIMKLDETEDVKITQGFSIKLVRRPWVAVEDLENRGQEEDEPRCFGVSSYLRKILETIPTKKYKIGVVPISELLGFDRDATPSDIRERTGARFMLKGTLDLRIDPCAVEVKLWRTEDDVLLWDETIIEPWQDIQSTTKRIAATLVEQVLIQTATTKKDQVKKQIADVRNLVKAFPESDIDEFDLYNRGIFKQNRFNNLRQDVDYQDAEYDLNKVEEISGYLNHEAMAQLGFLYILGWETTGDQNLLRKSGIKWEQILENRPDDSFALAELGYVSYVSGSRDPIEAIKLARRAVGIDPKHAFAHNILALLYLYLGYYESNITIEKTEVFPRSPTYVYPRTNAALSQQLRGYYGEALKFAIEAREIQHKAFVANLLVGAQYFYMGQLEKADRAWIEGLKYCPEAVVSILEVARAWIRAREGDTALAKETLQTYANDPWLSGAYGPYYISLAALLGENELAITLLEKESTYASSYRYLISEPTLKSLRDDLRFQALLEKRYQEWIRNLDELEEGLPNLPNSRLLSPAEFLSK